MKVVIAGGGTAGWLSALFISKIHPHCSVTVIESTSIGVIGTGEGSTGLLRDVLKNRIWDFGCNERDFLQQTYSVPKLGINFQNWGQYNYISPIDGSVTSTSSPDKLHLYAVANNIPNHLISYQGIRAEHDKLPYINFDDFNSNGNMAYHFDGQLVGKYFKSICDVDVIDDIIIDACQNEQGNITSLVLQNTRIDNIDLIIDCLGFNSIFKKLDRGWVDYSKHLPVNTALPFQIKNKNLEKTKPLTGSIAKNAGWMWQIPVADRYGCGYVFCDEYITKDQAYEEIVRDYGEVDIIKTIKFKSGRLEQLWKNNVVAIGLSSGFLEPLQATAIHTVICHLATLCFEYINNYDIDNQGLRNLYNRRAGKYFDDFADFLSLHYQCGNTKNDFWKYMTKESATDFVKDIIDISKVRSPDYNDFPKYNGAAGASLWNPTVASLGILKNNTAKNQLDFLQQKQHDNIKALYDETTNNILSLQGKSMSDFMRNLTTYY
jgi:hypothetical protein